MTIGTMGFVFSVSFDFCSSVGGENFTFVQRRVADG